MILFTSRLIRHVTFHKEMLKQYFSETKLQNNTDCVSKWHFPDVIDWAWTQKLVLNANTLKLYRRNNQSSIFIVLLFLLVLFCLCSSKNMTPSWFYVCITRWAHIACSDPQNPTPCPVMSCTTQKNSLQYRSTTCLHNTHFRYYWATEGTIRQSC